MNAKRVRKPQVPPPPGGPLGEAGTVVALDRRRIERALRERARYKYVHPRVEALGAGWKVLSPNCSRSVTPDGGEIDIAWLLPSGDGNWLLHARDHAHAGWVCKSGPLPLVQALQRLCADPEREYWL